MNRRAFATRFLGGAIALTTAARLALDPASEPTYKPAQKPLTAIEKFLQEESKRISEEVQKAWMKRYRNEYDSLS